MSDGERSGGGGSSWWAGWCGVYSSSLQEARMRGLDLEAVSGVVEVEVEVEVQVGGVVGAEEGHRSMYNIYNTAPR